MSDFNLFELLDLDPSAGWDRALFERRLGAKQSEWSGLTTHPKRAMEARYNLQLVPKLREVAADSGLRATHAAQARVANAARRVSRLRSLEATLAVIQAKGYVLDSELADLVKRFGGVAAEAEVRSRLHVTVVKDPLAADDAGPEELDASTAGHIRNLLGMVRKGDLYDFLGLPAHSPVAELRARADKIYERTQKSAVKDVGATARAQLAGQCRALLGTETGKARYDATLHSAGYDLLRELADVAAARTRSLSGATVDALLRQCLGADAATAAVERASSALRAHALRKGYALEMPGPADRPPSGSSRLSLYIIAGIAVLLMDVLAGMVGVWWGGPLPAQRPAQAAAAPAPVDARAAELAYWTALDLRNVPPPARHEVCEDYRDKVRRREFPGTFMVPAARLCTAGSTVAEVRALPDAQAVPTSQAAAASASPSVSSSSQRPAYAGRPRMFRDCPDCPQLVMVPAGSFQMGSPPSEEGRDGDEGPVHTVSITHSFAVGRYPVTRGEWRSFVQATGHPKTSCNGDDWENPGFPQDDNHPVVCITWNDVRAYSAWLSQKTGHHYRLLSEAEYEYVGRAGSTTRYVWGDSAADLCAYANGGATGFCESAYTRTSPVGHFPPNPFGLYDTTGNVWELTEDCYHRDYEGAPADGSAWEDGPCPARVVRGGSSYENGSPAAFRSAARNFDDANVNVGARVARTW